MSALVLERRAQADETAVIELGENAVALFTPPIGEDYWEYRVRVADGQAVVGFGKFGTIGIGFAVEKDWNTNLPYRCETETILSHIWHNHGPNLKGKAGKAVAREAIAMIQAAVHKDRGTDPEKDVIR